MLEGAERWTPGPKAGGSNTHRHAKRARAVGASIKVFVWN